MKVLLKTLGFSLTLLLIFTAVSYVLPQMEGKAPTEIEMDMTSLTMESFTALGKDLFEGKGTCTLCHNKLGRAPDLMVLNVVKTSLERVADSRYHGKATDAETYLRESMLHPSLYVVSGFGKKGSNDTESPMPAMNKPPAELSEIEINAIIAYLQNKDDNTVTVTLPSKTAAAVSTTDEKTGSAKNDVAQNPEQAITKFGCAACHSILKTKSAIGPDLNNVGARQTINQIRESIIAPNAVTAEGFPPIMPDFSEKMTIKELEILVQFLVTQKMLKKPNQDQDQNKAQP